MMMDHPVLILIFLSAVAFAATVVSQNMSTSIAPPSDTAANPAATSSTYTSNTATTSSNSTSAPTSTTLSNSTSAPTSTTLSNSTSSPTSTTLSTSTSSPTSTPASTQSVIAFTSSRQPITSNALSTTIATTPSNMSSTTSTPVTTTLSATTTQSTTTATPTTTSPKPLLPTGPCAEETLSGLTFPVAAIGQISYSKELCPSGTANAGAPMASAQCLSLSFSFGGLRRLDCGLDLEALKSRVNRTVEENLFVASSVQILTSKPQQLTSHNITSAATVVNNLLSSAVLNETVAGSVVATISQLMHADTQKYSEETYNALESLTKTLEDFALNMGGMNSSALVQPNLVVQSVKLPNWTPQVQFYSVSGLSESSHERVGLGAGNTNMTSSSGRPIDLSLTVKLSNDSQKDWGNKNLRIGFVLYENDNFFNSKQMNNQLNTSRRVVSASINDRNVLDNVEFAMAPENISGVTLNDFACVFWDYDRDNWRTDGCVKIKDLNGVHCKCNHTTNFAVLMSFRADYNYSEALNWISIVGCSLSIVGLVLTVVYQIKTRKRRGSNSTMLLVNICMCMITYYLLFIFGINNPVQNSKTSVSATNTIPSSDLITVDRGPCTAITALLQYFLLATFVWNIMYAAHVFFLIRNALNGPPRAFRTIAMTAGWGLPAVIVGTSLATTYSFKDPLGYRQEEFCWLASLDKAGRFDPKRPMLWGFLLPLAVMLSFNISLLVYFSQTICCGNPNLKSSRSTPLKKKLLSSFSLAVVLGLSWIIGYFVLITHDKILYVILSVVFCLCNTTQGVQIFILFTLKSYLKTRTRNNQDSKTESMG